MVCVFGVLSEERAPSSVVVPEPGVLPLPGERGPSSAFGPDPKAPPLPLAGVKRTGSEELGWWRDFWKTRDNGGKAAWLFIEVLSSVYWIGDVITDYELAVLIIRACSSRNLFIKHHIMIKNPPSVLFFLNPYFKIRFLKPGCSERPVRMT